MIWVVFLVMALVATAFALFPIFRPDTSTVVRSDAVPAVLADQLEEVRRDLDRGLISAAEAKAAELEIKKRILSVVRRTTSEEHGPGEGGGRAGAILAALFVPLMAFGYYTVKGAPDVPALAFAERAPERVEEARIVDLVHQLHARLQNDPNGGASEGWMLLGQTYMRMQRFEDAVRAFETVADRSDATSATWSMLAEALIGANAGTVVPGAEAAIERALEIDATNPAATFYAAVAESQGGDDAKAYDLLTTRLTEANGYAAWMDSYVALINRLAQDTGQPRVAISDYVSEAPRGPSAADVAAARDMSEGDRADFIRSMVDRLASRLEAEPDDLDGWMRLGNAYKVLNERKNAIEAYSRAQELLEAAAQDDPRRQVVENALRDLQG